MSRPAPLSASSLNADAYFMRRLSYVRQLQQLPASIQFDLARSPMSDDDLDEFATAYGVPPKPGFGIADVAHELLSAQPRSIPVRDIIDLQNNLKEQGYLPPDYVASGIWDDASYSGFRRFDRDMADTLRSGKGFLSGALESGVRILTATLPSVIWQNTVGAAKGIVQETPEFLERGGAVGGLAAGAAVGFVAGGPIGAAVGGGIGAVAGFLADFFGEEEEEPANQGDWSSFIDALTPWTEYQAHPREVFNDLSYITTAATLTSGAKLVAGGVGRAFGAATEATRAAVPIGEAVVGEGVQGAAAQMIGGALRGPVTGAALPRALIAPNLAAGPAGQGLIRTALGHPVATGAIGGAFMGIGGAGAMPSGAVDNGDGTWTLENGQTVQAPDVPGFGDLVEGALWGAGIGFVLRGFSKTTWGNERISALRSFMERKALSSRPAFQMVNQAYSGLARTSVGIHLTAGLSIEDRTTPLERSIEETEPLETGVDFLGQDLLDWTAALVYPEKFFPWGGRQLAASADRLTSNSGLLRPITHVVQQGSGMSFRQAADWTHDFFVTRPEKLTEMWLDAAVDTEVAHRLNLAHVSEVQQQARYQSTRSSIIRRFKDEAAEAVDGHSPYAGELLEKVRRDPEKFEAWLVYTLHPDKPLNVSLQDFVEAQDFLRNAEVTMRREGTLVAEAPSGLSYRMVPGGFRTTAPIAVVPPGRARPGMVVTAIQETQRRIVGLERAIDNIGKMIRRSTDNFVNEKYAARRTLLEAERDAAKKELTKLTAEGEAKARTLDDVHFTPARLETPTRSDFADATARYKVAKGELQNAQKAAQKAVDDVARRTAEQILATKKVEFDSMMWDFQKRDLLTSSIAADARNKWGRGNKVENALQLNGAIAARDVNVDDATRAYLTERGYKPVVTGDEALFPYDMEAITGLLEVPKLGRARNFFETVVVPGGFRWTSERSLSDITWAYTKSQLDYTLAKEGVPMNGRQAIGLLNKYLDATKADAQIDGAGFLRPLATVMSSLRFKADIRRLTPGQIEAAFGSVPGVTSGVADEIFQAIKRGNAFGGELKMLHPLQSARLLGRATRTAGLPGASQVIRSWHAKDFTRTLRGDVLRKELTYNPLVSPERGRVVNEIRIAAGKRGFTGPEVREAERLFDVMADSAVRSDPAHYPTLEDFFRRTTVRAASEYVEGVNQLRQTMWREASPNWNRLDALAKRAADERFWYEDASGTLSELFSFGNTTLRNGERINDYELMLNLIAATKPLKSPAGNLTEALKVLLAYKNGEPLPGLKPNTRAMVDDVLSGKLVPDWEPGKRLAGREFYFAIKGDAQTVTVDTWMLRLFGLADSPASHAAITEAVRASAQRLGWDPRQTQAAMWVAFKDEAATLMARMGEPAHHIAQVRRAESFSTVIHDPLVRELIDTYGDGLGRKLLQNVENRVKGMTEFGDDYRTVTELYSTGDFSTLTHEAAHVMRRILPEDVMRRMEERYGVRKAVPVVERDLIDVTPHLDELVARTRAGGETFDPHTGRFLEPENGGFAVAMTEGHAMTVRADGDVENAIRQFVDENAAILRNERAHVGTENVDGIIHIDPSEVVPTETEALRLGAERGQERIWDFKNSRSIDVPEEAFVAAREKNLWPEAAEERFADDMSAYLAGTYRGEAGPLRNLKMAVASLWGRNREALLDKGLVPLGLYREFDRLFKEPMERAGLARPRPTAYKQIAAGAIVGATEGYVEGDSFEDIIVGAAAGAAAGQFILRPALKATYGYLPDALANLNLALRYTLSFTFDAGRYLEQNSIAAEKYGLEMFLSPKKYITGGREWKSPYSNELVHSDEAWNHMHRFFDELNGVDYFARLAESEQKMFQQGMLGFSPREFEAAQAWQMYQLGWGREQIFERVAELGRYGLGRTNAERSANFIFFPFSFSKKLLTTLGDFIAQAPARNLLIVEGMRRYHESLVDEEFGDFVQNRAPILQQLWRVNNLAWGMSLGRFFLEGIDDRRTNVGRVAQLLASAFVPSGSATPMQQAIGAVGDLSVNLFTPVVITGESISRAGGMDGLDDIIGRYIPVVREIDSFWQTLMDQKTALVSPSHRTPWSQFQEYSEQKAALKDSYEPIAMAMGYKSVDGLFASDIGLAMKTLYDQDVEELRSQYPQGWEITTAFENQAAIDEAGLADLAAKTVKTEAEEAFLELVTKVQGLQSLRQYVPEEVARVIEQGSVREFALRWAGDRRFAELYHRFLERLYGPIRRTA